MTEIGEREGIMNFYISKLPFKKKIFFFHYISYKENLGIITIINLFLKTLTLHSYKYTTLSLHSQYFHFTFALLSLYSHITLTLLSHFYRISHTYTHTHIHTYYIHNILQKETITHENKVL